MSPFLTPMTLDEAVAFCRNNPMVPVAADHYRSFEYNYFDPSKGSSGMLVTETGAWWDVGRSRECNERNFTVQNNGRRLQHNNLRSSKEGAE